MTKLRWTTQIMALVLANIGLVRILELGVCAPFFYCHACPAAGFACPIGLLQNYAAVGQFPFYAIGTLALFGLALGRFWCGWVCPFGTMQDLTCRIRRRKDFIEIPRAPWMKYVVLGVVLLIAWVFADLLFCKICPAGSLFGAIPQRFVSPDLHFGTFFYVHLATLAIAIVGFFLVGRFWCRYLCPLGAILGAFNPTSIMKVKVDFTKCNNCSECLQVCPVKITDLHDVESSTDCTRCGRCVEACKFKALSISASFRR